MYVISYLKQGFGNKVFIFANIVYLFLELKKKYPQLNKLYIAEAQSKHQINPRVEKIKYFFPNIEKEEWIEFVCCSKEEGLKKGCQVINQNKLYSLNKLKINEHKNIYFEPNYNMSKIPFDKYPKIFDKLLKFNRELITSQKYDFKKDIFMHIRYGDKLDFIMKGRKDFVVLKPEFYIDSLELFNPDIGSEEVINVHVFTDSVEIVKEILTPEFEKMKQFNFVISDEPYWNVFYLASKFENLIISSSTLVNAGLMLNKNYKNVVAFKYEIIPEVFFKKNNSPWPNSRPKGLIFNNQLLEDDYIKIDNKKYMF